LEEPLLNRHWRVDTRRLSRHDFHNDINRSDLSGRPPVEEFFAGFAAVGPGDGASLVKWIEKGINTMVVNKEQTHEDRDILKGLSAGLLGGLIASWTMNRFQDVWIKLADNEHWTNSAQASRRAEQQLERQSNNQEQDDTTVRAASAISEGLFLHKLTENEKKIAGPAVHYSLGTSVGGLYGAVAEVAPQVTAGAGIPFGAAFWLVVDEGAVPLLGLSKGPMAYPLSTHLYALASHFVYGLTAEVVRCSVRHAL
jgi:putative membrane protein